MVDRERISLDGFVCGKTGNYSEEADKTAYALQCSPGQECILNSADYASQGISQLRLLPYKHYGLQAWRQCLSDLVP